MGFIAALVLAAVASAKAAPPVEDYGKLPAISDVRMSPSGDSVAFVGTIGETRSVNVVTADAKPLARVAVGSSKVRNIAWAGENHILIETTATTELPFDVTLDRSESATVIVFNLDTGKEFQVFGRQHEVVSNSVYGQYGTAKIDGHWYGWFATVTFANGHGGVRHNGFVDLYRVDLDSGDLSIAARGELDLTGWLVDPGGQILARSFYLQKTGDWSIKLGPEKYEGKLLAAGHSDFGGAGALWLGRSRNTMLVDLPTSERGDQRDGY
jgi:dipeptidyl aminopeptidase/acylaminoacyl peptidase